MRTNGAAAAADRPAASMGVGDTLEVTLFNPEG
ncbi:protein of unknown function [Cupriavidus taiwanensis]|nr:protein of unknown function [Cupriavidus taiwanensis]